MGWGVVGAGDGVGVAEGDGGADGLVVDGCGAGVKVSGGGLGRIGVGSVLLGEGAGAGTDGVGAGMVGSMVGVVGEEVSRLNARRPMPINPAIPRTTTSALASRMARRAPP